jgi:hypothetical protein
LKERSTIELPGVNERSFGKQQDQSFYPLSKTIVEQPEWDTQTVYPIYSFRNVSQQPDGAYLFG